MRKPLRVTPKKLLITGCGRSGTAYIAFLLRRLGMDIEHESMGKDGIVSWVLAVDSDVVPWGYSPRREFAFESIFHQVRHPLEVIPSLATFKDISWEYICEHTPCRLDEPLILRGAKYWYYWNCKVEEVAHWRYRIEDLSSVFETMCHRLHISPNQEILDVLPKDINTRTRGRLFHIYEKICERCRVNPSSFIRYQLLAARKNNSNVSRLTWEAVREVDQAVYELVKGKAMEYGYPR